jgi:arginyl-tRNA synthetase
MAAIRYRAQELKCDRVVYVTDIGQEFHFKLVFAGGLVADFYDPKKTRVDHMPFGMVLQESGEGEEKKTEKIKTRSGDSVKLSELLDEAKNRAMAMFEERSKEKGDKVQVEAAQLEATAEKLGISAIKYYDLR